MITAMTEVAVMMEVEEEEVVVEVNRFGSRDTRDTALVIQLVDGFALVAVVVVDNGSIAYSVSVPASVTEFHEYTAAAAPHPPFQYPPTAHHRSNKPED
mmetsp:Transcript_27008/g.39995  ORF Transcript_27008/g.39995 Transcript_27008/m.39995 type:complete len:99 (-) Transcript_27008:180-476(-)